MKNAEALLPTYHLEEAVLSSAVESVHDYVDNCREYIFMLLKAKEHEELQTFLRMQERLISRVVEHEEQKDEICYSVGYYRGLVDSVRAYINSINERKYIENVVLCGSSKDVQRQKELLFYIEAHEGIQHGELAKAFQIDKSTLTGIMNKMVKANVLTFTKPGKFKYYYLTELGRQYCADHQSERLNQSRVIDDVVQELKIAIARRASLDKKAEIGRAVLELLDGEKEDFCQEKSAAPEMLFATQQMINATDMTFSIWDDTNHNKYEIDLAVAVSGENGMRGSLLLRTNQMPEIKNKGA